MKPQGIVYRSEFSDNGEVRISLSKIEIKFYKFARLLGASLVSLSLSSIIFFYGQALLSNINNKESKKIEAPIVVAQEVLEPTSEQEPTPETVNQFSLSIPKINANSEVIHNVDPFNEESYKESLKSGVAHAQDTGLPGQGKRIYLFAHSTNSPLNFSQYNAVFYQLRDLAEGDQISVFLNQKEYKYVVSATVIVNATDTSWLTQTGNEEELVLQTCDPPGTTLRRLLVIAKPVI